jgi:hypothetical protein
MKMTYYRIRFDDNKVTVWNQNEQHVRKLAFSLKGVKEIETKTVDKQTLKEYNDIIKRKRGK